MTFVAKASSRAAVRVSHHLVLPRYRAIFSLFCLFPGGTPPIVRSPIVLVDASVLPLRRSALVKSSS